MGTYLMMLYVSLEQETAVKDLFMSKGWGYKKPDLSVITDKLGPPMVNASDITGHSDEEELAKDRTKTGPATRESSRRTTVVKHLAEKQSPGSKSAKKTEKVKVQLRTSGKKSADDADFQEILEEAELIAASINPDDEAETAAAVDIKVEEQLSGDSDDDAYGNEGDNQGMDEDMEDDYNDGIYLEAGADMTAETVDTPRPAKRRKAATNTGAQSTEPDVEAGGETPAKTEGDLDLNFTIQLADDNVQENIGDSAAFSFEQNEIIDDLKKSPEVFFSQENGSSDLEGNVSNSSVKSNTLQCAKCGKTYISKSKLERHEEVHGDSIRLCYLCGKQFTHSYGVEHHIASVHFGYKYSCKECEGTFETSSGLWRHNFRHHRNMKYECKVCSTFFNSKSELKIHRTEHKEENKYLCSHCPQEFSKKTNYDSHMASHVASHEGMKLHTCHKCGKNFKSRKGVQRHIKICGSTDLKYACDQCGMKFKIQSYLTEHVNRRHGNKFTSQCSVCGQTFRYRSALHKHRVKSGHR